MRWRWTNLPRRKTVWTHSQPRGQHEGEEEEKRRNRRIFWLVSLRLLRASRSWILRKQSTREDNYLCHFPRSLEVGYTVGSSIYRPRVQCPPRVFTLMRLQSPRVSVPVWAPWHHYKRVWKVSKQPRRGNIESARVARATVAPLVCSWRVVTPFNKADIFLRRPAWIDASYVKLIYTVSKFDSVSVQLQGKGNRTVWC